MKKLVFIFLMLASTRGWALPEKVEIVFLSEPTTTSFYQAPWTILGNVAQNDWKENCIPSGDGCFHPQLGFIPADGPQRPKDAPPPKDIKTFNSMDVNLVDCREGEYFDIFCGKAKEQVVKATDVEIWIDTSASLRKMDFSTDPQRCERRSFVEAVQRECGAGKITVQTYDTSIKTMATLDGLCQNYGSNDIDRLIKWIKASNAKYLMIVTDIDELSRELRDFLDSIGAKYHGGDVKDYTVKDLSNFVSVVKKNCK